MPVFPEYLIILKSFDLGAPLAIGSGYNLSQQEEGYLTVCETRVRERNFCYFTAFTLGHPNFSARAVVCVCVCVKAGYFHIFMDWIYQDFYCSDYLEKESELLM